MATSTDSNRNHWHALAAKIARRVNVGWWLDQSAAPLVITAMAGACVLLLVRRENPHAPAWWFGTGIGGVLILLGLITWLVARRKFESPVQSLVRIEAAMRLRNALSAAEAGVTAWPEPVPVVNAGVRWNWPRLAIPPLGAIALLAASLFIPVSALQTVKPPTEQPQAWQKIDSDLDKLAKDAVVDEPYIEEMKKRVDDLRAQKQEDWFSHSSLEATDSLKKAHQSEVARMDRELGRAEKALQDIQKNASGGSEAEGSRLANEFDQALQGLQNGAMKPNPELLKQLKEFDPKNLGQLSPDQMQQLKDNLGKAAQSMKDMEGQGGGQGQGDDWADQLMGDKGDGKDKGQGQGQGQGEGEGDDQGDGEGLGKGGTGRGPGHSDNPLGKEHDKRKTGDLATLEAKDLSHTTPGDLLQLQNGEHDVDKTPSKIGAGGDTSATGQGGDRVWKESLDPSEQRAMKKFFSEGK